MQSTHDDSDSPSSMVIPRRFRTSFNLFLSARHAPVRKSLKKDGASVSTGDVTRRIAKEWKELSQKERRTWDAKAEEDKVRYFREMTAFQIRTGGQEGEAAIKVPKRPMSAFLAFSNQRRAAAHEANKGATSKEISRILAEEWRSAPEQVKRPYVEEHDRKNAEYKAAMKSFRTGQPVEPRKRQRTAASVPVTDSMVSSSSLVPSMAMLQQLRDTSSTLNPDFFAVSNRMPQISLGDMQPWRSSEQAGLMRHETPLLPGSCNQPALHSQLPSISNHQQQIISWLGGDATTMATALEPTPFPPNHAAPQQQHPDGVQSNPGEEEEDSKPSHTDYKGPVGV